MELAFRRVGFPVAAAPVALTAAMLASAGLTSALGGPSFSGFFKAYFTTSFAACVISALIFLFVEVLKLARTHADNPLAKAWAALQPRLPLLMIPAFLLPLFLSAFTAVKSAIPSIVGFHYDRVFADIDILIFGADPWRLTHAVIGSFGTRAMEFFYVPVWLAVLTYSHALIPLFGSRRSALTFFTASMLTWLICGGLFAYLLASAGPTFVELNGMEDRFAELRASLLRIAGPDSGFVIVPGLLIDNLDGSGYGAGISAMPSMHVAACVLYCLSARGTRWLAPAIGFLVIIVVGSVHSGFHYAVDGPVAALISLVCWRVANAMFATRVTGRDDRA